MKILREISIFFITILVMIVGFEFFLGTTEISIPSFVVYSKNFGRTFKPNTNIIAFNEGFYLGSSNKFGYLGPSYAPEKPDSVFRIALIGDSFVEGMQLFERMHFRTIIENELNKKCKKKIEVLNFGRAGSDFRTQYIYYKKFASTFNPDVTLFFIGASSFLRLDRNPNPTLKIEHDSLIIDTGFWNSPEMKARRKYEFIREIPSFSLIQKSIKLVKKGRLLPILFDKLYPVLFSNNKNEVSLIKSNADKFYSINKKIIEELGKNKKEKKEIVFVVRDEIDHEYLEMIVKTGLPVIRLDTYLKKVKKSGFDPTYWATTRTHGHWNVKAHSLVGKYLASELLKKYSDHCLSHQFVVE